MKLKYSFDKLVNSKALRTQFMSDYDKLIRGLKKHGFNSVAAKHARNKKRILEELELLD